MDSQDLQDAYGHEPVHPERPSRRTQEDYFTTTVDGAAADAERFEHEHAWDDDRPSSSELARDAQYSWDVPFKSPNRNLSC